MKFTNYIARPKFTLRIKKSKLNLGRRTRIMGILNITPDSFSNDGLLNQPIEKIIDTAQRMVEAKADIIDVGGESSRPNSIPLGRKEELKRVIPVIKALAKKINTPISIDTYKPEVAEQALDNGACMINDISGFRDSKMPYVAKKYNAAAVLMHMRGRPSDMQNNPRYGSVIDEIIQALNKSIKTAIDCGISRDKIIIDPGIGFGKTPAHNLEIIAGLFKFRELNLPILIGPSRKSFIGNILKKPADKRLLGTAAAVSAAIANGAHIVRVHDVEEIHDAVKITDAIINAKCETIKNGWA